MKHTKTPWRFDEVTVDKHGSPCSPALVSEEGEVAVGGECQWEGLIVFNKKEDMDFLLHAANNYDRFVKALRAAKNHLEPCVSGKLPHSGKSASLPLVDSALRDSGEIDG